MIVTVRRIKYPFAVQHIEAVGFEEEHGRQVRIAAEGDNQGWRLLDATQLRQDAVRLRATVHCYHSHLCQDNFNQYCSCSSAMFSYQVPLSIMTKS